MENDAIKFIKRVYQRWKVGQKHGAHPDEETVACFTQGLLSAEERKIVAEHIVRCFECAELVAISLKTRNFPMVDVPENLLVNEPWQITLRLGEKILEIINAAGDVLVGQELLPVPVLRGRSIKDFKDEITIFKEFKDIRVEVRVTNRHGKSFDLRVIAKNKATNKDIKDLRVGLFREDRELESYLAEESGAVFENIELGKYTVELSNDAKFASIRIDIKS